MRTLIYYTDSAHGWLHVPGDVLAALNLGPADFSQCSYWGREGALYLEEDCDMQKFLQVYQTKCGEQPIIKEIYSNGDSFVRGMPRNTLAAVRSIRSNAA